MKTICLTLAAAGIALITAGAALGGQPPNPIKIPFEGKSGK